MKKESAHSRYVVPSDTAIEEAMKTITLNKRGAVVVVDKKDKVLGIASDGDIRRALIRGVNVMASINKAMNTTVLFIRKGSEDDKHPEKVFKKHPNITLLPVVNQNFVLSHLYKVSD
jgi:CBS domain-containing protein